MTAAAQHSGLPWPIAREIAAGSLAAGFTATMFSPLEMVKTRLQVSMMCDSYLEHFKYESRD